MRQRDAITMLVRGEVTTPTAAAEVGAIASVPDSSDAWVRMTLARDITTPIQLRLDAAAELTCRDGWRGHVLAGVVHEADEIREHRAGVFLRLLDDLGVSMIVRAGTGPDLETAMNELLPQIVAGSPDWSSDGEVIAISQLYAT